MVDAIKIKFPPTSYYLLSTYMVVISLAKNNFFDFSYKKIREMVIEIIDETS